MVFIVSLSMATVSNPSLYRCIGRYLSPLDGTDSRWRGAAMRPHLFGLMLVVLL